MNQNKIIGIDLGTTNSCVAVVEAGQPVVIANSEGYPTTPSIVAFAQDGNRMVGHVAKRQAITNPERTVHSIKRIMGTKQRVDIDHRSFSPEQISALILQKLKKQAQDYLGKKVSKAIITVPAYFDDAERLATRDAGEIAGLEVVRIINEPTASALSYGLGRQGEEGRIVVFDFGGGTFDVTILEMAEQVLHVRATNGNNRLGGDDFDQCITDWVRTRFIKAHGIDPGTNPTALQRLREAAEKAKIELSGRSSTEVDLPFLAYADGNPLHFQDTLSVDVFNDMSSSLVKAVALPVQMALSDAKLTVDQIDKVILVGGTTRIPAVRQFIKDFFGKDPVKSVNPDEAVALGAAIQGGILSGDIREVLLVDVVPISIGLALGNGTVNRIFERNTTIPASAGRTFTTSKDNQTSLAMHIVQGEDAEAGKNKSLAKATITGIQPGAARSRQIAVTFTLDADGIFSLEAVDTTSGAAPEIIIERTHGLTREGLQELASEAAREAEQERLAEERTAATVSAQSCLQDAERILAKHKERLGIGQETAVRAAMVTLREAAANESTQEIERLTQELESLIVQMTRAAATS